MFAGVALLGVVGSWLLARRGSFENAFRASSVGLVGFFAAACIGVHPYGLVARVAERSVLLKDAAADGGSLAAGLAWWLPAMTGVVAYSIFAHRRLLRAE